MVLFNQIASAQYSDDLSEIIRYGTFAPSSHNAQMWSVHIIDTNSVKVNPNYQRVLKQIDPDNRETWISIGAFIGNCILAANDMGYKTDVTLAEDGVVLSFIKANNAEFNRNNIRAIKKRITDRRLYLKSDISDSIINKITSYSDKVIYIPRYSAKGEQISEYTVKAYCQQMNSIEKLEELSEWISFSYKEEREKKYGLTPDALDIKGIKHFLFNTAMNKKSVKSKMFIRSSERKIKHQINSCSGYLLIMSDSKDKIDLIEAGILLEHVWLECAKSNIAVHPISQVLEELCYYSALKKELNTTCEIQMILRIGNIKKYPIRERRRISIEHIIKGRDI